MAKVICNVTIVRVMDTWQKTANNPDSQKVMERANKQMAMAKDGRKEMLRERAKERPEPVTIAGRRATLRTVVGKAKEKAKAKDNNGVGKAKVLMRLTTVTEKLKLLPKLTLEESG